MKISVNNNLKNDKLTNEINNSNNYYPDISLKYGQNLRKAFDAIFSYTITFLNLESENINNIIKNCSCPECNYRLRVHDCHNKNNNLKVTFLRFCNRCHLMFIFSGRYKNEEKFDKSLKFFIETIYSIPSKRKKEFKQELIEKIKINPKSFGIDIVKDEIDNNIKIKKKNIQIVEKPGLRDEYRRRMNKNVK